MRNVCPCCGLYVHTTAPGNFDICPICKWEDDNLQRTDPELDGGANEISLNQAKKLFAQGKDTRGNPILLPLFSVTEVNASQENVQVMANCRLVMAEGRTGVVV